MVLQQIGVLTRLNGTKIRRRKIISNPRFEMILRGSFVSDKIISLTELRLLGMIYRKGFVQAPNMLKKDLDD